MVDKYSWRAFGDDIYGATTAAPSHLAAGGGRRGYLQPIHAAGARLCAVGCLEGIPPGAFSECEISQDVDVIFFLAAAEGTGYLRSSGRKILLPPDPSAFNVPA